LGNWVLKWRTENPEPEPELNPLERVRLRELEDQNRKLRMENEFLKEVVRAGTSDHLPQAT
jgi:transposase-like protein